MSIISYLLRNPSLPLPLMQVSHAAFVDILGLLGYGVYRQLSDYLSYLLAFLVDNDPWMPFTGHILSPLSKLTLPQPSKTQVHSLCEHSYSSLLWRHELPLCHVPNKNLLGRDRLQSTADLMITEIIPLQPIPLLPWLLTKVCIQ